MESVGKAKRLRIITGPVAEVETTLNHVLDEYAVTVWNFQAIGAEMHCTAVLVSVTELRKAALMQQGTRVRQ